MGGPTAIVLLPELLNPNQIDELKEWIGASGTFCEEASKKDLIEGWDFLPNWPTTLGANPLGTCVAGIQMYVIDPLAEYSGGSYRTRSDWARVTNVVGWTPACELVIWSNCNQPWDHRILGWQCIQLATRYGGLVDMGSTRLNLPAEPLPGRVYAFSSELDETRMHTTLIVDSAFLQAWLDHPNFHVIK